MQPILWILASLLLTIGLECTISSILRSRQLTYSVLVCNLLTNPLLNLILLIYVNTIGADHYLTILLILELLVVPTEALVIKLMTDFPPFKALLMSLLFNAASFGLGLLLW